MPSLTDIDSRAAIRGSRAPLGAQAIWTLLGWHVVGGLTTNTTSVQDFGVLLLGSWFVENLDEAESREEALPVFIRSEQLASYARFQAGDTGFRGTTRTRRFVEDGPKLTISSPPDVRGQPRLRGGIRPSTADALFRQETGKVKHGREDRRCATGARSR